MDERIRSIELNTEGVFRTKTLHITYPADQGATGMGRALSALCDAAEQAVRKGYNMIVVAKCTL